MTLSSHCCVPGWSRAYRKTSQRQLLSGEKQLLKRVIHLVRVACVTTPHWLQGRAAIFNVPAWAAWPALLNIVQTGPKDFGAEESLLLLGLVRIWAKSVSLVSPYPEKELYLQLESLTRSFPVLMTTHTKRNSSGRSKLLRRSPTQTVFSLLKCCHMLRGLGGIATELQRSYRSLFSPVGRGCPWCVMFQRSTLGISRRHLLRQRVSSSGRTEKRGSAGYRDLLWSQREIFLHRLLSC